MGEIVDEIVAKHLNAVQLLGHMVETALQLAKVGALVKIFRDFDLKISLGDFLGGVDHVMEGTVNASGGENREQRAHQNTGAESCNQALHRMGNDEREQQAQPKVDGDGEG